MRKCTSRHLFSYGGLIARTTHINKTKPISTWARFPALGTDYLHLRQILKCLCFSRLANEH